MSVVHNLDTITAWVREHICTEIQLKVPPDSDRAPTDAGYDYQMTTPAVFPLYIPARDKLPPGVVSPVPSVCVRFLKGSEQLAGQTGSMGIQLCFSTWDTGLHGEDFLHPVEGDPGQYRRWSGKEAEAFFQRSGEGWRDAWNFVDIALRKLGNTISVGDCELDRSVPFEYGPFTEQGEIIEAYPLWYAWVSFSVTYPLRRNAEDIEQYL